MAQKARDYAHADGSGLKLAQQSVSSFLNNGKRVPEWFRYAERAIKEAGGTARQSEPVTLMLPVQLPSGERLAQMFRTILRNEVPKDKLSDLAQDLALLLPAALADALAGERVEAREQTPARAKDAESRRGAPSPHAQ